MATSNPSINCNSQGVIYRKQIEDHILRNGPLPVRWENKSLEQRFRTALSALEIAPVLCPENPIRYTAEQAREKIFEGSAPYPTYTWEDLLVFDIDLFNAPRWVMRAALAAPAYSARRGGLLNSFNSQFFFRALELGGWKQPADDVLTVARALLIVTVDKEWNTDKIRPFVNWLRQHAQESNE